MPIIKEYHILTTAIITERVTEQHAERGVCVHTFILMVTGELEHYATKLLIASNELIFRMMKLNHKSFPELIFSSSN